MSGWRRRELLTSAMVAPLAVATRRVAARTKARVIVIGGGFGGSSCALALRRLDPSVAVTLVDSERRYVTCPMSNAVLAGWRNVESLTIDRHGLRCSGATFVHDRVVAIDADKRQVTLSKGTQLPYDRLVVAPGIRLLWGTPLGYDEAAAQHMPHAWIAGAQTTLLVAQLRSMRDGGTVAISVPAGLMRCPPGPFERASTIAAYLTANKPRSKILIFDNNNRFPRQDAFSAAWNALYPGMIEWIAPADGGVIERVDVRRQILFTSRGAQRVDVANIIPPQAPGQLALDAGLSSGHGWCPADATTFESAHLNKVHVIGDACIAGAMPRAASAAHSQALQCAAAIVASLSERPTPTAAYESVCYSALAADRALSIHGKFGVVNGEITSIETRTAAAPSSDEQRDAQRWYENLRGDAFADVGVRQHR